MGTLLVINARDPGLAEFSTRITQTHGAPVTVSLSAYTIQPEAQSAAAKMPAAPASQTGGTALGAVARQTDTLTPRRIASERASSSAPRISLAAPAVLLPAIVALNIGTPTASRIAEIAITISSSISVMPRCSLAMQGACACFICESSCGQTMSSTEKRSFVCVSNYSECGVQYRD